MAKIYHCKTKTLIPYEHFGLDSFQEVIGNLNIEDCKSSLSNNLTTQEEVDNFNKDISHKTGKDLSKEYLPYTEFKYSDTSLLHTWNMVTI